MSLLNRRRFLTMSAAAFCLPAQAATRPFAQWRGVALGAPATLRLSGLTQAQADPIFASVEDELSRLENIFSLYRETSEIARLNASGRLSAPSHELLEVLSLSDSLNTATGGAFDPTVQTLWQAAMVEGSTNSATGWQHLRFDSSRVEFAHPNNAKMGLTLNGIAQGYITDKIASLLRGQGLQNVLVDFGEIVAGGERGVGENWRVGVATPDGQLVKRMTLKDRALATSASFMPVGENQLSKPHIFATDPNHYLRHELVSVSAPTAAIADGLSTAFCLLSEGQIQRALEQVSGAKVEVLRPLV